MGYDGSSSIIVRNSTTNQPNPIRLRNFVFLPILIQIGVMIGNGLPREKGLRFANWVGTRLGSLKRNAMVRAIRANQWVIHNQSLSEEELDELPKTIFRSAARCMFDYFYYLTRPEKLRDVVDFSESAMAVIRRINNQEPSVVVCPHLSNFELMGFALAINQINVQVLSYPRPNESYKQQNKIREQVGLLVTPINFNTFRQARNRLREGGSILTGLDRPLTGNLQEKYRPLFFGHTANLPVFYVRMAKEANAPVFVLGATSQPEGRYRLESSGPIWMEERPDIETEIVTNANRVLKEAEKLIKKYSEQWAMLYPVWPQFLGI